MFLPHDQKRGVFGGMCHCQSHNYIYESVSLCFGHPEEESEFLDSQVRMQIGVECRRKKLLKLRFSLPNISFIPAPGLI